MINIYIKRKLILASPLHNTPEYGGLFILTFTQFLSLQRHVGVTCTNSSVLERMFALLEVVEAGLLRWPLQQAGPDCRHTKVEGQAVELEAMEG